MNSSLLHQEIFQQPAVIAQLYDEEYTNIQHIAAELDGRSFRYILIAARGTSDNAARYAQYLYGAFNHIQVALATPSLFTLYQQPPDISDALVIGISQSGQSPDIVSVLQEGRRVGSPTLAITNDPASDLANHADYVIPLHAGPEKAVAATKTYTTSLTALAMLSSAMQKNTARLESIQKVPSVIQNILQQLTPKMNLVARYRYMEHCAVIGRGFNYSTAFEIALKLKELTYVKTEPYSSADFRHGPIATIDQGFPVILIAPGGSILDDIQDLSKQLNQLGAETIVISDDEVLLQHARLALPVSGELPEWLTPLVNIIPGQLFSMQLVAEKGLNPDQPRGLHKVTETY